MARAPPGNFMMPCSDTVATGGGGAGATAMAGPLRRGQFDAMGRLAVARRRLLLERGDRQDFRLAAPGQIGEAPQHIRRRRPVRAPADVPEQIGFRHELGLDVLAARLELTRQAGPLGARSGARPAERNRLGDRPAECGQDHESRHDPAAAERSALHERFSASAMLISSCPSPPWARAGRTSQVLSWNRGATAGSRASAAMKFAISTSRELAGSMVVLTSIWSVRSLDWAAACGDCACPCE